MLRPLLSLLALGTALAAGTASAVPTPLAGGTTSVLLTSAPVLGGAGVTVGLLGTATLASTAAGPEASFPITGGVLDPSTPIPAGTIEHDGSGLSLATATGVVELENFLIDTVALLLSGDVSANGSPVGTLGLFSITTASSNPAYPFQLLLTPAAGAALASVLGIADLSGAQIGLATTAPLFVPEPATILLLAPLALLAARLGRPRARSLSLTSGS